MRFCFDTDTVEWLGAKITMKPVNHYNSMFNGITDIVDSGTQPGNGLFLYWLDQMNFLIQEEELTSYLKTKTNLCYTALMV